MLGKFKKLRLPTVFAALNILATDPVASQINTPDAAIGQKAAEKTLHDLDVAEEKIYESWYLLSRKFKDEFFDAPNDDARKFEMARNSLKKLEEYENDIVPESHLKTAVGKIENLFKWIRDFRAQLDNEEDAGPGSYEDRIVRSVNYRKWAQSITKRVSDFFDEYSPGTREEAYEIAFLKVERGSLTHYLETYTKSGK